MSRAKKIAAGVLSLFAVIQVFQPARNKSGQVLSTDITHVMVVPQDVLHILKTSCYDCHSNNTVYPWYFQIQPVAWFMNHHIQEGKSELNFSDFGSYSHRKQTNKLKEIISTVYKGEMPLWSYTIIHNDARLSSGDKEILVRWADSITDLQ